MGSLELDPNTLDALLSDQSYVGGHQPSQADTQVWQALGGHPNATVHPHMARWYTHMASYSGESHKLPPAPLNVVFHCPKSSAQAARVTSGVEVSGEAQSSKTQKAPSNKKKDAEVSVGCVYRPCCSLGHPHLFLQVFPRGICMHYEIGVGIGGLGMPWWGKRRVTKQEWIGAAGIPELLVLKKEYEKNLELREKLSRLFK